MKATLQRISSRIPDRIAVALYKEAQIEMTESKRRVPVDTGALRGSGHVEQPTRSGNTVSVVMAYGGQAETYAIQVHEDMEAFHRIGQAKYLESVINESAPHMLGRLASRLKNDW